MLEPHQACEAPLTSTLETDRRVAVRYPCDEDVCCAASPAVPMPEPWSARVRDISTTGIGLVVNRAFDPGTSLRVELQNEDLEVSYTLMAHVVHAALQSDAEWLLGCAFARYLSDEELARLL